MSPPRLHLLGDPQDPFPFLVRAKNADIDKHVRTSEANIAKSGKDRIPATPNEASLFLEISRHSLATAPISFCGVRGHRRSKLDTFEGRGVIIEEIWSRGIGS